MATQEGLLDPRRQRIVLFLLAGMALMVNYVETMVLPAFQLFYTFFAQAPYTTLAWILSAYLLVGVVVTPLFGKLGDLYGKRRVLLIVMSIYAVAVSLAGFSPNLGAALGWDRMGQLYLFIGLRAVQGIGIAMFPLAFAMIGEEFPPSRVGAAQGIVSAMFGAGAAVGLVGGGYLAQTFGWQFTYHTVIPVAVALVLLALWKVPESRTRLSHPLDLPGSALLGAALTFVLLGITEGPTWGWTHVVGIRLFGIPLGVPEFFGLGALATGIFLYWEPRAPSPVVSFARLRERNIWVSNVVGAIVGTSMMVIFVAITVLVELPAAPGFDQSGFVMGLVALPSTIGMLGAGPWVGRQVSLHGPKPVILGGFGASALGGLALVWGDRTLWEISGITVLLMTGIVAVMIGITNLVVLSSDRHETGIQTGMNQTFRNLGAAIGPVLATTVLASYLAPTYLPNDPVPVLLYSATGFHALFLLSAGLALVGLSLSLGLRNFRYLSDGRRQGSPGGLPEKKPAPE
jgi:MFS family permease